MRACVIFNPAAGRRRSRRRMEHFHEQWKARAEFWPMKFRGHGTQLAQTACERGFTVIAAAGGDGTVHEVANGLLQAGAQRVTLAVVPVGSANDYAYSLARQFGESSLDDDTGVLVDVGVVEISDQKKRFFVESLGLAFSAQVTLESRQIRRLQGKALYALAVCRALRNLRAEELLVQYDQEPPIHKQVVMLSAMLGHREGGFVLARSAVLNDGLLDVVEAAPLSRLRVLGMLPRIALAGLPEHHPNISRGRCKSLHVQSTNPLVVHTDGEMFSTAADAVHDLAIRALPSWLRVKLCLP